MKIDPTSCTGPYPLWGWIPVRYFCGIALLCLVLINTPGVENASARFDQANRLYEQGNYDQAAAAYTALLDQGISPALYFNLGNAYFKNGKTGAAIASYRIAQRLAPRDPDILANLRFARESVNSGQRTRRPWERVLNVLSTNELSVVAAALLWTWLLLLATREFRPDWDRFVRSYRTPLGVLALTAVLWLGLVAQNRLGASSAIVTTREATVRYGPFEEAQAFYTVRDGAEFTVLDRKDDWLQVSDRSRRTGWLRVQDAQLLPRG